MVLARGVLRKVVAATKLQETLTPRSVTVKTSDVMIKRTRSKTPVGVLSDCSTDLKCQRHWAVKRLES